MTSVDGYGAIRFFDSVFYKAPHRGSWESALTYNANQVLATFSRRFSNWDYASERVHVSPFSWIDDGPKPSAFDDARSPEHVAEQLLAFRKWGMGGEFANYAYAPLADFDYSPYVSAMQAGSKPGRRRRRRRRRSSSPRPPARRSRAPRTTTSRSGPCAGATIAADPASPG